MSYLVSEFLINPVIRQARRFSSGFATAAAPDHDIITSCSASLPPGHQWRSAVIEEDDPKPEDTTDEISIAAPNNMVAVEQLPAPPQLEESSDPGRGPVAADDLPTSHANSYPQDTMAQDTEVLTPPTRSPDVSTSTPSTTSNPLPEDDGMGLLRSRIIAIQALDLPQDEKAALMHHLLMEGYNRSQVRVAVSGVGAKLRPESKYMWEQALATGPLESYKFWNHLGEGLGGLSLKVSLSEDDLRPTFVPVKEGEEEEEEGEGGGAGVRPLGCEHYRRNVKMQCATCERWYTCRLCHDAVEDHQLPRKETVHMLCMVCGCAQKVGDACIKCGTAAARYYCGVCKLWNDDPDKSIYHCNDCGICRVGQGLGKDFFHCNKCMACIAVSISEKHKCIERSTDRDCPICGDNMFDSVKRVIFMDCGHTIHHSCFKELLKTSYRCPLCNKSVVNMEIQFRNYDAAIQNQPMPDEYRDARAVVSCNDCSAKSQTAYHWLGLRCSICQSYNTVALQLLNLPSNALAVPGSEVAALAVGAGAGAVSPSRGVDALPSPPLAAVAPPTMTAGHLTPRPAVVVDEAARSPQQHLVARTTTTTAAGARQPSSLPQETSEGSTSTNGPAFSPDGMEGSPPSLPRLPPGAAREAAAAHSEEEEDNNDADGFWDADVLGNILSSPGESDNDAGSRGPGSEGESESEDDSEADGEEEEDEEDDKEEPLMLPGHR